MKNVILICSATIALILSYFFEVAPESVAAPIPATNIETAMLVPYAPEGDGRPANVFEKAAQPLSFKDSLTYKYYAQNFNVKLDFNEDKALLETINDWIGTPYLSGSNTKRGTDCSGFVTRVYKDVYGITLRHNSQSMFQEVQRIKRDSIRTGDLVFFRRSPRQPIYHVGIYLKNGKFAHSATNGGVMISSLHAPYYQRNFYAAGRVNQQL